MDKCCRNCSHWSKTDYPNRWQVNRRECSGFANEDGESYLSQNVEIVYDDTFYGFDLLTHASFYCQLWEKDEDS